jgi:hypothetical protein
MQNDDPAARARRTSQKATLKALSGGRRERVRGGWGGEGMKSPFPRYAFLVVVAAAAATAAAGAGAKAPLPPQVIEEAVTNQLLLDEAALEELRPDSISCPAWMGDNSTLLALHKAVNFCASPVHMPTEIFPSNLLWTVDSSKAEGEEDDKGGTLATDEGPSSTSSSSSGNYVAFLMAMPGDHFSAELLRCVLEVSPAFPRVWFVVGNGPAFTRFTAQFAVRAFPRLLLFRDGMFQSRFRATGNSSPAGVGETPRLAAWLTAQTGLLPATVIRKRRPVEATPDSDPTLWVAAAYVVLNLLMYICRMRPS